jgi:hypothetical protein
MGMVDNRPAVAWWECGRPGREGCAGAVDGDDSTRRQLGRATIARIPADRLRDGVDSIGRFVAPSGASLGRAWDLGTARCTGGYRKVARTKLCDTCGHSTARPNDDHGMGLVVLGECIECTECIAHAPDECPHHRDGLGFYPGWTCPYGCGAFVAEREAWEGGAR